MNLAGLTAHEARDLLDNGDVTSVELTTAVLERVSQVEDRVMAFVTVTDDLALRQAEQADARISAGDVQPLTGIPMLLKDNMVTKGVPTTCSSRMLENFVPPYNATVTEKLYEQGAVLVGKGNLDEFAMGSSNENSAFHPTHNPWALDRVPGGSSGGPAAAVAADECLFSLGLRYRRKHSAAGVAVRHRGHEADLWTGEPLRAGGVRKLAGPDRTAYEGRARLRHHTERNRRQRPE